VALTRKAWRGFFFWPLCCLFFFDIRILILVLYPEPINEIHDENKLCKLKINLYKSYHSFYHINLCQCLKIFRKNITINIARRMLICLPVVVAHFKETSSATLSFLNIVHQNSHLSDTFSFNLYQSYGSFLSHQQLSSSQLLQ
jgi:hypothetical protein